MCALEGDDPDDDPNIPQCSNSTVAAPNKDGLDEVLSFLYAWIAEARAVRACMHWFQHSPALEPVQAAACLNFKVFYSSTLIADPSAKTFGKFIVSTKQL